MLKAWKKICVGIIVCLVFAILFFPENIKEAIPQTIYIQLEEEEKPEIKTAQEPEIKNEPIKKEITPIETEEFEEPEEIIETEEKNTCTLSVRCDSVLENFETLKDEKESIIPPDGIIYGEQTVEFSDGENVFDVLSRELKNSNIHFEFVKTPLYDSVYIEGIGNLYEFDCGSYSGWIYKVNGIKPNYGCSQYIVQKGDKIEFIYSCNFLEEGTLD